MVDIIGFASGVLGIYSFIAELFPSQPSGDSASVRLAVGLSGTGGDDGPLEGPDGFVKSVRIYNNNGEFLSAGPDDQSIGDGGYTDITLTQGNNQQAPYVQVRVGDGENICLAYVSVTFSDGQKRAWDGTWAPEFGLWWYYSGIFVSEDDTDTGKCIWMDGEVGTIFIYMPAFSGTGDAPNPDINSYIGTQGFRAYQGNDAAAEIALPTDWFRKKRSLRPADSRLVISDRPGHSAVALCESDTSAGPSFVSLSEGMFCDMQTREVKPLCTADLTEDCFTVPKEQEGQRVATAATSAGFSGVIDWTDAAKR